MKKNFLLAILLCCVFILSSCSTSVVSLDMEGITDKTIEFDTIDLEGKIFVGESNSDNQFSSIFSTIDELTAEAEFVVKGKVHDVNFFPYKGQGMTSTTVKVVETLKGDLQENDLISVVESGGVISIQDLIDYFGPAKFGNMQTEYIENGVMYDYQSGAAFSKVGQDVYLFLMPAYFFEGAYECYGGFMGKFTLEADTYVRHTPYDGFYQLDNEAADVESDEDTIKEEILQSIK